MRNVLYFLLINFFAGLLPSNISAQTIQETYVLAGKYYNETKYSQAIALYHRILYFHSAQDSFKMQVHASLANVYFKTRQFTEAEKNLVQAIVLSLNDTLTQVFRLQKAKIYLLQHQYYAAQNEIAKTDTINFPLLKQKVYLYNGLAFFGQEDYTAAQASFGKILPYGNPEKEQQLQDLFRKNKKIGRIDASVAGVLSAVLPGSGQVFSGNIESGMNSFLLTSAIAVIGYNTFAAYGLVKTLISVGPWYARYYTNGIKNAAQMAKDRQRQKRQQVLTQMLDLLSADSI